MKEEVEVYAKSIKQFCKDAPEVLAKVNALPNAEEVYRYIAEVVHKCVALINLHQEINAQKEFEYMVKNLKKQVND